jgi:transcriptional regulator
MYTPAHFAESDLAKLHDFIEGHSFATLVSQGKAPFASHLPFLLERDVRPLGRLVGHMARANPHWSEATEQETLVIFSGPHAYISPTWYEASNVVPTWNYLAVHVYGAFHIIDDPTRVNDILRRTVETYERSQPQPWEINVESEYLHRLTAHIVAFEIEISRIEGKWKLNQNHPRERREKVIRALEGRGGENATRIAQAMRDTL